MAEKKIHYTAELQSIYLRFINVDSDERLTAILSKLLQSLVMVYLEPDLVDAVIGNSPKIAQLDEIMAHLTTRVTFSAVKAPVAALLGIVNTEEFSSFQNRQIKQKVLGVIYKFIKPYSQHPGPQDEDAQVFQITLTALSSETLTISEKCRMFVLCLHRMQLGFQLLRDQRERDPENRRRMMDQLKLLFEEDFSLKKVFIHFSLLLVIAMFPNWHNQLRQFFHQAIMEYYELNRKLNETQFLLSFEKIVFSMIATRELFDETKEFLPIVLIGSADGASAPSKDTAAPLIKTVLIDHEDLDMSAFIYQMIFGNFNMFFNSGEQGLIGPAPFRVQEHLIHYLMKFPDSVKQRPFNLTLVDHCLFNYQNASKLQTQGLSFVRAMLRSEEQMNQATQEHLYHTLKRIWMGQDQNAQAYTEESRAMSCLLLAELASRNYHLIFGSDVTLAIDAFEGLRARVEECNFERKPVRMDDVALTYMEAVNKFRDCFEHHVLDGPERQRLSKFVEGYLAREGANSDGEIVYILFLYLARLSRNKLTAPILLNSIVLKSHEDIKIRKEAQGQLDRFAKAEDSAVQGLLQPFLHSLKPFFRKYLIEIMDVDHQAALSGALSRVMEVSSAEQINAEFIDKVAAMSKFALDFYKREQNLTTRLDIKDDLEKLFLANLHGSFTKHKSDFTGAFSLIHSYLRDESEAPVLSTFDAARAVTGLSHGANCVNLEQKMFGLRLLCTMLAKQAPEEAHTSLFQLFIANNQSDAQQQELPKGQEARLSMIFRDTLQSRFGQDPVAKARSIERFKAFASLAVTEKISPNTMELQKMIANSMAALAENQPLTDLLADSEMQVDQQEESKMSIENEQAPAEGLNQNLSLDEIIEKLRDAICNRTLDLNFRCHLLKNIGPLCKHDVQRADQMATSLLDKLKDYDHVDFQHVLGKTFCNLWLTAGKLATQCDTLIEQVEQASSIELNVKRNYVVYLHQLITVEGHRNDDLKQRLLALQQIFLKFLFDRRASMQDLASRSLSTVYNLGDEATRQKLVDSLSGAFTGQTEYKGQGKNVDEELEEIKGEALPAELRDNFSAEQKKKMKTYSDLASVANQLGNKKLIYQFLEIHRTLNHLQDVQSAAKGLSNIIMLDAQLKQDLVRLAPSILLLTYDQNQDVSHTMRELWTVLIDIDQEAKVIEERWQEIYEEAFKGIQNKENPRNKLRAVRALTDLMGNRTWHQIKRHFRVIFLTGLASLNSERAAEKVACYQLAKALKSIALRLGNVYTNGNEGELRQVLSTVIPMVLDDCLKSSIQPVRWFGLDLLSDIVMTARSQNVAEKLKIKSKHERQLMFNYNSAQKIKEILNSYMERIIVELIGNASAMIKAIQEINLLEQLAIELGYIKKGGGNAVAAQRYGISEREINNMRTKMTKESTHGEILQICREMMTKETFDKILPSLLQFAQSGHDISTKSTAVVFINDIVLEGRLELIAPQKSRLIARRLVAIYAQSTVSASLEMKESLQHLYASCLGTQMKILREYPGTIVDLLGGLADLDPELEIIKVLNLNEIVKALPESMLSDNDGAIVSRFTPNIFVNRYKTCEDTRIKSLSKRNWDSLVSVVPNLAKTSCPTILGKIAEGFNSTSYDDRVASAQALQELCGLVTEAQLEDANFAAALDAIMTLVNGKYFNSKEKLVECFAFLVAEDHVQSDDRKVQFLQIAASQAAKASGNYNDYKNALISAMQRICTKVNAGRMPEGLIQEIYDFLIVQLTESLESIVAQEGAGMLAEARGVFFDLDERREDDKAMLKTVQESYGAMPRLLWLSPNEESAISMLQILVEASADKFVRTNWLVRQAILQCFQALLEQRKTGSRGLLALEFGATLVSMAAEYGEKYDQNLVYLSAICLLVAEQQANAAAGSRLSEEKNQDFKAASHKLIVLLQDKGTEVLVQNIDLIKRYVGQGDTEMTQQ